MCRQRGGFDSQQRGQTRCAVGTSSHWVALFLAGAHAAGAAPAESTGDWPVYGLDSDEQRFSPLHEIDDRTVNRLGLAWSLDLDKTARSLEATPLELNGVLYFTTALSVVYAVDARSGKVIWTFDPKSWEHNPQKMQYTQGYNRGVALGEGNVYVGSHDGRLIALDARTGTEVWSANTLESPNSRKTITGAPRFFRGKVIIGNGGRRFRHPWVCVGLRCESRDAGVAGSIPYRGIQPMDSKTLQ